MEYKDLEQLVKLIARMSPGPWKETEKGIVRSDGEPVVTLQVNRESVELVLSDEDLKGIVTLRNAAETIIAHTRVFNELYAMYPELESSTLTNTRTDHEIRADGSMRSRVTIEFVNTSGRNIRYVGMDPYEPIRRAAAHEITAATGSTPGRRR